MVLTRKDMIIVKVEKGEGMAEVLKVELIMKNGRKRDLVVVYVPLKTNALGERRVWKHFETHMQMFKEYDRKQ